MTFRIRPDCTEIEPCPRSLVQARQGQFLCFYAHIWGWSRPRCFPPTPDKYFQILNYYSVAISHRNAFPVERNYGRQQKVDVNC